MVLFWMRIMEFSSVSDRYLHLTYFENNFYKKIYPIKFDADHQTCIGLANVSYLNNTKESNFPGGFFWDLQH